MQNIRPGHWKGGPDGRDREAHLKTALDANIEGNNRVSKLYDAWHPEIFNDIEQARLARELSFAKGCIESGSQSPRALDFGAGTGNLTNWLVQLGFDVVAADVAEKPLERIRERLGDGIRLSRLNGEDLGQFEDGTFELAATYSVLHHVPDYLGAVREMVRVLRPGGVLYLDHEVNRAYWDRPSEYEEFLRLALPPRHRSWKRFFRPRNYYNTLRDIVLSTLGYCDQGDIHVTVEDHIDWDAVQRVVEEAGCEVVKREDYLLYRAEYDLGVYREYEHRCADVTVLIARRDTVGP